MIRAGKEISLVDAAFGRGPDLGYPHPDHPRRGGVTAATLPSAFFHQLIKHGEAWQDFIQRSLLGRAWRNVTTSQREVRPRLPRVGLPAGRRVPPPSAPAPSTPALPGDERARRPEERDGRGSGVAARGGGGAQGQLLAHLRAAAGAQALDQGSARRDGALRPPGCARGGGAQGSWAHRGSQQSRPPSALGVELHPFLRDEGREVDRLPQDWFKAAQPHIALGVIQNHTRSPYGSHCLWGGRVAGDCRAALLSACATRTPEPKAKVREASEEISALPSPGCAPTDGRVRYVAGGRNTGPCGRAGRAAGGPHQPGGGAEADVQVHPGRERGGLEPERLPDELQAALAHELGHVRLGHFEARAQRRRDEGSSEEHRVRGDGRRGADRHGHPGDRTGSSPSASPVRRQSRTRPPRASTGGTTGARRKRRDRFAADLLRRLPGGDERCHALVRLFERLERERGGARWGDWLSTHPAPARRVEAIRTECAA